MKGTVRGRCGHGHDDGSRLWKRDLSSNMSATATAKAAAKSIKSLHVIEIG